MTDERESTLRSIVGAKAIVYEYDLGDSRRHAIEIEDVAVLPEPGLTYPICTGGDRSRPPEDCGGASGYEELLEALADPEHEEHASMTKWVGKKFAPEQFDLAAVNRALQRIGNRVGPRNRARANRIASLH